MGCNDDIPPMFNHATATHAAANRAWLVDEVERLAASGATPGELLGALPYEMLREAIAVLAGNRWVPSIPPQNEFLALRRVLRAEIDRRT